MLGGDRRFNELTSANKSNDKEFYIIIIVLSIRNLSVIFFYYQRNVQNFNLFM